MRIFHLLVFMALTACGVGQQDLAENPDPIGNFRLGLVFAEAAPDLAKGPLSREKSPAEIGEAMTDALNKRFSRFDGSQFYHIGVTVRGYILARRGVPVVFSPKSTLVISIVVIEDATGTVLTPEPHEITVFEDLNAGTMLGSGYTRTADEQLQSLAHAAARNVETWLRKQDFIKATTYQPAPLTTQSPPSAN